MAYLNKRILFILLSLSLLLISLTSAETTFFEGDFDLFITGQSSQAQAALGCSLGTRAVLTVTLIFFALTIVIITLLFFFKQGKLRGLINTPIVITVFVAVILGLVFIQAIADSILAVCP